MISFQANLANVNTKARVYLNKAELAKKGTMEIDGKTYGNGDKVHLKNGNKGMDVTLVGVVKELADGPTSVPQNSLVYKDSSGNIQSTMSYFAENYDVSAPKSIDLKA